MEEVKEICFCHRTEWSSRIELLDHQVSFYQRQTWEGQRKTEVSRVALGRAGVDPTAVDQRELEVRRKNETLQKKEEKLKEEQERVQQESGRIFDAMNILAAWES